VVVSDEQALETMGEMLAAQAAAAELGLNPQPVEEELTPTPSLDLGTPATRQAAVSRHASSGSMCFFRVAEFASE
jgi:hypothetical protein